MLRSLALGKVATAMMLLALPLAATGCQSTGGWGWSPPSVASLNPWKSSSSNSQLASSKPSNQVPTPPATMLAGSGLARNGSGASGGAPTYNASTYGGTRPSNGYSASTGDYDTRQVSATQGEGYPTGRYNTGGSTAQQGPYGGAPTYGSTSTAPNYGGAAAATADRRSDPTYGASNSGWQNYNSATPTSQPSYNQGTNTGAAGGYGTGTSSSYAGATGLSTGASRGAASSTSYGGDAYRPGSTARGSDEVQRASFDNQGGSASSYGSEGNYPTTPAGDESAYQ